MSNNNCTDKNFNYEDIKNMDNQELISCIDELNVLLEESYDYIDELESQYNDAMISIDDCAELIAYIKANVPDAKDCIDKFFNKVVMIN